MGGPQRRVRRGRVTLRASIIVCTRDRPEVLRQCLAALQNQTANFSYETIVVDNSATGSARDVVTESGVRYTREEREGLSRARNRGVAESHADIVAFIDDDAVADSEWLASLVNEFGAATGAVAGAIASKPGEFDLAAFAVPVRQVIDRSTHDWFERAAFGGVGNGPNMAFRRDALLKIGGFDERLGLGAPITGSEEHDAFVRLVAAGFEVVSTPDAIVVHSSSAADPVARAMAQRRAALAYILLLILTRRNFRWRAARYLVEALVRKRRTWRSNSPGAALTVVQSVRAMAGSFAAVTRALADR
jgi:GT2 family glycosyltransferase